MQGPRPPAEPARAGAGRAARALDAASIDAGLRRRIEGGPEGIVARVHSVHDRTVNVVADGYLFCLADTSLEDAPRTIRVPAPGSWGMVVGDPVAIGADALVLRPGRGAVAVRLGEARRWEPRGADFSRQTTGRLREHGGRLSRRLGAPRPRSAFEALSAPLLDRRVARLGELLATGDAAGIAAAAADLIGLGAGLTPSGDDVLVGLSLLAAQDGLRLRAALPGLRRAARTGGDRTTPVSAAMLAEAADGRARQPVHELLGALSGHAAGALAGPVERVIRIGHSSGADLLRGVLLGLDAEVRLRETASGTPRSPRGPR